MDRHSIPSTAREVSVSTTASDWLGDDDSHVVSASRRNHKLGLLTFDAVAKVWRGAAEDAAKLADVLEADADSWDEWNDRRRRTDKRVARAVAKARRVIAALRAA